MTTTEQRPQTASDDHVQAGTHPRRVVAGSKLLADQARGDIQVSSVGEDPNFPGDQSRSEIHGVGVTGDLNSVTTGQTSAAAQAGRAGGDGPNSRNGRIPCGTHASPAVAGSTSPDPARPDAVPIGGSLGPVTQTPEPAMPHAAPSEHPLVRASTSPAASADSLSKLDAPPGTQDSVTDHAAHAAHEARVGGAPTPPGPAIALSFSNDEPPVLADPLLALAADVLDDLERIRIANENRLRQLTRSAEDKDGEERGFGLSIDDPNVRAIVSLVAGMNCKSAVLADLGWERPAKKRGQPCCLEHEAESNLTRLLRNHPLGPWVKQARGVGEKQAARLLAAIGDPYWNTLHNRPRLVSELWSYAGYGDAAAQVRKRGQKSNWSTAAKMRAYLVSVSIIKAGGPYREVYDAARAKYDGATHTVECKRCGPAGKPASIGSPISAGHQHGRALRAVSKELLRDLWREAQRLHELADDHFNIGLHCARVVSDPTLASGHLRADTHGGGAAGEP